MASWHCGHMVHSSLMPTQPAQHHHIQLSIGTTSSALAQPACAALWWSWWPQATTAQTTAAQQELGTDPTPAPRAGSAMGPHPDLTHGPTSPMVPTHPVVPKHWGSNRAITRSSTTLQPTSTSLAQNPGRAITMLRATPRTAALSSWSPYCTAGRSQGKQHKAKSRREPRQPGEPEAAGSAVWLSPRPQPCCSP